MKCDFFFAMTANAQINTYAGLFNLNLSVEIKPALSADFDPLSHCSSGQTAAGLPENTLSVKASIWYNFCFILGCLKKWSAIYKKAGCVSQTNKFLTLGFQNCWMFICKSDRV